MDEKAVRPFQAGDLDAVMEIWLSANLQAHSFIPEEYWRENAREVRRLLPEAAVYVREEDGVPVGFIGLQENYIAGLFVRPDRQSGGIGGELLRFAKEQRNCLCLSVYKKNERALRFYLRQGFRIKAWRTDENTGELEASMLWRGEG